MRLRTHHRLITQSVARVAGPAGLAWVVAGCAIGCAIGCTSVSPHQRGRLAAPDMAVQPSADLVAGQAHSDEYREAAVGGWGGSGGGCGCN
ncbi:MAG: DUF4266 domain-containing protein [Nannocystaceae bacterium]|nr:DUF4266 domain-containing protein [Nannocystaceae bacterium]